LLSIAFLALGGTTLPATASHPAAFIISLLLVVAVGPITVLLAFALYPLTENPISAIPLYITGWALSAALAGALVAKCVRASGRGGYIGALILWALIHLPIACFLTVLLLTG
jgi:hypothetical protein